MTDIQGWTGAGFEPVAEAFSRAFEGRPNMGAALSVRHQGKEIMSLWGGVADERDQSPWSDTTASVIFSCTKGLVSILAAKLVEEGRLDYAAPVARYWPEFAEAGKAHVTVADVLAHRAGLSAPATPWTFDDLLDSSIPSKALARQSPLWPPGTGHAYHAITHGWLVGEVIRRASGQDISALFEAVLAQPLGVLSWIGLPADYPGRVAHLQVAASLACWWDADAARDAQEPNWPYRSMTLGGALPATLVTPDGGFNDRRLQEAVIPGAGGIATASALAAIWSATVTPTAGVRLLTPDTVELATRVVTEGPPVFDAPPPYARWGMGFQLDSEARRYLTARSFGHEGAGGQSAFADPVHDIGFAFLTNWMEAGEDNRATAIIDALRGALT